MGVNIWNNLPIGYKAIDMEHALGSEHKGMWLLVNHKDQVITFAQVDSMIPLESHIRYVWSRYLDEKEEECGNVNAQSATASKLWNHPSK